MEAYVDAIMSRIPATETRMEQIRKHQEEDPVIRQLKLYCQTGWPARAATPGVIRPYRYVAAELTVEKGLLMRVVIPTSLRVEMLDKIPSRDRQVSREG